MKMFISKKVSFLIILILTILILAYFVIIKFKSDAPTNIDLNEKKEEQKQSSLTSLS